jgi:hypothetical protein
MTTIFISDEAKLIRYPDVLQKTETAVNIQLLTGSCIGRCIIFT